MQLRHGVAQAQMHGVQVDLAAQVAQVIGRPAVVPGDDLVAGAVVAQRFAERNVHVQRKRQRQGRRAGPALGERLLVVGGAESLDEAVGGRVGRVARPRDVETPQQLGRN